MPVYSLHLYGASCHIRYHSQTQRLHPRQFHVFVFVQVHVKRMEIGIHMCLYVWGPEDSLRRHASATNHLFLKQDLFLAWDLQLASVPQGFAYLVSIALGLQVGDRTSGSFTLGFWGPNAGSPACKVSTVQMEPSPPSHRCL